MNTRRGFAAYWQRYVIPALACLLLAPLTATAQTAPAAPAANPGGASDIEKVERLLAARREYQTALEQLRAHYISVGDTEKTHWAEDELRQYHRTLRNPFRLELDVPPPTLQAAYHVPEANELYRRAMTYKDKGWGNDYVDNQRRAEILFQQILTSYPQSDMIDDSAFQLADMYEGRCYKQYRRAALYYERCFQWNPNTQFDARLRAARIYDHQLNDKAKAQELYNLVASHETDPKQIQEAKKRLAELGAGAR